MEPVPMLELLKILKIDLPLIQAPMAGVSNAALAAAVANAGALGSIGVGATNVSGAQRMITALRERTHRSFNVNLFCHQPAQADTAVESAWLERLRPQFEHFGAAPPARLQEIYKTFLADDEMLAMLLAERPPVVSFHFGVPARDRIQALRDAGIVMLAAATSLHEARQVADSGIHAVVAQGYEAGGHRGSFDPEAHDDQLGTMALTRLLVCNLDIPVIAAGGIMDGAGIGAVLRLGAGAAQLGTAFVACTESDADASFRAALASDAAHHTVMTRVISGRPARCLSNLFTAFGAGIAATEIPDYPIAYDAGKALNAAGKAAGEPGYGAHLAGQGAPLVRPMSAAALVATLSDELRRY
jgi:nitronate monooxygenase